MHPQPSYRLHYRTTLEVFHNSDTSGQLDTRANHQRQRHDSPPISSSAERSQTPLIEFVPRPECGSTDHTNPRPLASSAPSSSLSVEWFSNEVTRGSDCLLQVRFLPTPVLEKSPNGSLVSISVRTERVASSYPSQPLSSGFEACHAVVKLFIGEEATTNLLGDVDNVQRNMEELESLVKQVALDTNKLPKEQVVTPTSVSPLHTPTVPVFDLSMRPHSLENEAAVKTQEIEHIQQKLSGLRALLSSMRPVTIFGQHMKGSNSSVQRISQACERCRVKRTRCSGEKPCSRCLNNGEECSFGYPRGGRRQSILSAIDEHNNKPTTILRPPKLSVATLSNLDLPTPNNSRQGNTVKSESPDTDTSLPPLKPPDSALSVKMSELSDDHMIESPIDVTAQAPRPKKAKTRAKTRKTRTSSACLECKKRRRKCTGKKPCQACMDFQTECVYDPTQDRRSKAYFQKRLANGVLEASQSDQNEDLMNYLRKNADVDTDIAMGMERALRLADQSKLSSGSIRSSKSPSTNHNPKGRKVCTAFCGLAPSGSPRVAWCPADIQKRQLGLLAGPEHLILPHIVDDSSPLSTMFVKFRTGATKLLRAGTPLDEVLGPLDPVVDLLFRQRTSSDAFSASTWACEITRLNVEMDLCTQLANAFLLARFMRWILAPSLENYMLLPEIMWPTHAQRTIPHYPSADLYSIPAVRDSIVRGELQLLKPIGTPPGAGIRFSWPFDLDKALTRHPVTGTATISRLFGACAGKARHWSCTTDFLANSVISGGVLNVVEHQHAWHGAR